MLGSPIQLTQETHLEPYKTDGKFTPYTSIFHDYPGLFTMVSSPALKKLNQAQYDSLLTIGESVGATRYPNRDKQRVFLDEKTTALEAFLPYIAHIASDKLLYDVAYSIKNSYHQTALGPNGVIAGRYPVVVDFISRIRVERDRAKNGALLNQQVHRAELEDARNPNASTLEAETQAAKEAAVASKPAKKSKSKKKVKSRATVEDGDESPFDDADYPVDGNAIIVDCISTLNELRAAFRDLQVSAPSAASSSPHRHTQSLDERVLTPPTVEKQQIVAEEFSPPSTRKRAKRSHIHAHEDSEEQIAAAELATNNPTVKHTVAAAHAALAPPSFEDSIGSLRLQEAELRSRVAFANAQLRYQLDHREYLLNDLKRVMDSQHQRSHGASHV
ncbi:hypothetical protein C8R46DRAFT_1218395 [Mycena filopes]|nr:hypothetical protein C8R46DRAFT_1218395 [Mycena filopes]